MTKEPDYAAIITVGVGDRVELRDGRKGIVTVSSREELIAEFDGVAEHITGEAIFNIQQAKVIMVQHYLAYTRNCWGSGATEAEALANLRDQVGGRSKDFVLEVFDIPEGTADDRKPRVGDQGGVEYWKGQERKAAWRVNGAKRTRIDGAA